MISRVRVMRYIIAVMVAAAWAAMGVPVAAHHSFAAEFDDSKCSDITGTLTSLDWQNPHAYFYMERKDASGTPQKLQMQTSSLANMIRGGTPRQYFMENIGKTVTVRACASHTTANRFAAEWIRVGEGGELHRVGQDVERIFGSNN